MTEEEFNKILTNAPTEDARSLFRIYVKTGLRRNELLGIRKEDVRLSSNRYRVLIHGKGGVDRDIVLNKKVEKMVVGTADDRKPGELVFPFSKRTVDYWFRVAADKSGLGEDVTLHSLRHTAATWSLQHGAPIESVRDFMGHSNIATTNIYVDAQKRFENPPEDLI